MVKLYLRVHIASVNWESIFFLASEIMTHFSQKVIHRMSSRTFNYYQLLISLQIARSVSHKPSVADIQRIYPGVTVLGDVDFSRVPSLFIEMQEMMSDRFVMIKPRFFFYL